MYPGDVFEPSPPSRAAVAAAPRRQANAASAVALRLQPHEWSASAFQAPTPAVGGTTSWHGCAPCGSRISSGQRGLLAWCRSPHRRTAARPPGMMLVPTAPASENCGARTRRRWHCLLACCCSLRRLHRRTAARPKPPVLVLLSAAPPPADGGAAETSRPGAAPRDAPTGGRWRGLKPPGAVLLPGDAPTNDGRRGVDKI